MNKLFIIMGFFLVSAQVQAVEHKPVPVKNQKMLAVKKVDKAHKPTPKVTVVSFEKKSKKAKKPSMKALDKKLKQASRFKSSPCKEGYISNEKAYCAVKAKPKAIAKNKTLTKSQKAKAIAKLNIKQSKKLKPQRMVASQKDLESKRKK